MCMIMCVFSRSVVPDSLRPVDCSLPGSSVHGFSQARILERVVIYFSGDLPDPGIEPVSPASPALTGGSLPQCHLGSPVWRLATSVISLQIWWSGPWRVRGCLSNYATSEQDLWVPGTRILIATPPCVSLRVGVH